MLFRVAFRNKNTDWEWVEMYDCDSKEQAQRCAIKSIAAEMKHSEIGIFGMKEGASYWKNRKPRLLYNRQPYDGPISPVLGSLINDFYTSGNNVR